ncbi:MAG TPA: TRAP transporter small permease [Hyphomicrobiaceae bacterium]|nr:TRAP transporter small permease [Hyphomicrobiaceae bacterium]
MQTPTEHHTPITSEEIARTFEEAEVPPVHLGDYAIEDWLALIIFWLMCGAVFLQFFTRYVLNNSFAWTEEIAIYSLVSVVFLGSVMCARLSRHIQVDFLYRFLSPTLSRVLSTLVDLFRIAVYGYLAWLVWKYSSIISDERMTTIDFPKLPVFMIVAGAFALMALRSIQVAWGNWRRGYSILERPDAFDNGPTGGAA